MSLSLTLLPVALIWLVGGIVNGATGLGAAIIAVPVMALLMPAKDAIFVACLVNATVILQIVWAYGKFSVWKDVRDLLIGCLPGCVLGVVTLKLVPVTSLELMIASMLVIFILMQSCRGIAAYRLPDKAPIRLAAGGVCGFVSSSVGMQGVPLGIYVLLRHFNPDTARGNISVFLLVSNFITVSMHAAQGMYNTGIFVFSLAGSLGFFIGGFIGIALGRGIGQKFFRYFLLIFLAVSAVLLFIRAAS